MKNKPESDKAVPAKKKAAKKDEKEDDPVTKALKKRKKESLKAYEAQAAEFEKAGIAFAFSNLTSKSGDLKKNLKRMIEAGLSEKTAMAALTINPAKILGINDVTGTAEKGKMANLFISDKPFFEEKSAMKFIIVEGHLTEIPKKEPKKTEGSGDLDENLLGTWSYTVDIPESERSGTFTVSKDGDEVVIKLYDSSTPDEINDASDISIDGEQVSFTIVVDAGGQEMPISINLSFEEEEYEGEISADAIGTFPIHGSKIESPE